MDWGVQFQRGTDETGASHRSHHVAAPPYAVVRGEIEDEILPSCLSQNIGVIVYSAMYAGLLTGAMTRERVANFLPEDWRRNLPGFNEPALSHNLRVVEHLREIATRVVRAR
jgi:aryl-alcohol dehydrogenase-like predicted oxidoreductase